MQSSPDDPVRTLRAELRTWQRRTFLSWLALASVVFATCANYTSTDDLVARRQLTVGDKGSKVHVQDGVLTITNTGGEKAVLDAKGVTFFDKAGKPTGAVPTKK